MSNFKRYNKLSDINKEWINSYPKIVDGNGCWIPNKKPDIYGYVSIEINGFTFKLHRLSMCVYHNIDYSDKVVARHSKNCCRACFNPEHLKSGSNFDNEKDKIEHNKNFNLNKLVCTKCKGEYRTRVTKTGWNKGQTKRWCPTCNNVGRLERKRVSI